MKIFTDNIENTALEQIGRLMSIGTFSGCKVRIMPDVHAGAGCVIGFTGDLGDKVIPNIVGVDIGCGMLVQPFDCSGEIDFHALNEFILNNIPSGRGIRDKAELVLPQPYMERYGEARELIKALRYFRDLKDCKRLYKAAGTLGGGNAVIAPVMLPIMASLGVTPTVVATLFKVAGEIGLILGPLTGVTLITEEVTGLSYGQLMIQAAIPFAIVWLAGAWVGANRAQKRTQGKESYTLGDDVKHLDQVVITKQQKVTTIAFLLCFVLLVGYGIATGQGTSYALIVMIVLAAVVAIFGRIEIDRSVDCITKGVASQANMFLIFVSIEVLLNLVTLGGGFDALSNLLGGLASNSATAVMLVASVVGGFGIEAAAVAEIKISSDMFGGLAVSAGLPMGCFAVSILAATRLTGSIYPTSNFAGQLGIAQCTNTKEALQAAWISVAFAWVFVIAYAIVGPMILG